MNHVNVVKQRGGIERERESKRERMKEGQREREKKREVGIDVFTESQSGVMQPL